MFKSVLGYLLAATLFCACSGGDSPITPTFDRQRGAKVNPTATVSAPEMETNLTASETQQMQGLWKLSGYYQYLGANWETNYTWDVNNPSCPLSYVWVNFHATSSTTGTVQYFNGHTCQNYTQTDINNAALVGSIIYEIAPGSGDYDTNAQYAPLWVSRNGAFNGYNVSFADNNNTMYLYNTGYNKTLIYVRASGGPSVP